MSTTKKILAILLSAVLGLAACTALAESSETPVTINFWHHYSAQSAENETLMNDLIPKFESENPGIKVNAVSHEWAELHDKILVSASSQSLPDVARLDIAWLPEFQQMGVLVALDQEMPDFSEVAGTLLDSALSTANIGGSYYALPLNTNSKILFYNTAMLEAAGVEVPMYAFCTLLLKFYVRFAGKINENNETGAHSPRRKALEPMKKNKMPGEKACA